MSFLQSDGQLLEMVAVNTEENTNLLIEESNCNTADLDLKYISTTCSTKLLKDFFKCYSKSDVINYIDKGTGRNVLHFAAAYRGDVKKAIEFIRAIVDAIGNGENLLKLLLASDKNEETPLYLAAKYNNPEICKILITGSNLDTKNNRGKTPILKIFKKMPEVIYTLKNTFGYYEDEFLETVNLSANYLVTIPTLEEENQHPLTRLCELDFLSNLSNTKPQFRGPILENPLVKIFVWLKWQKCKWIFYFARFIQVFWFLAYSQFLVTVFRIICPFPSEKIYQFSWFRTGISNETYSDTSNSSAKEKCLSELINQWDAPTEAWSFFIVAIFQILIFMVYPTYVRFQRRWFPMKTKNLWKYTKRTLLFLQMLHILDWIFVILIFLNTIPVLIKSSPFGIEEQYIFASVGIFLTWFQIFLQLGKIPQFKGYIKVFRHIMTTLSLVALMYSALIIAFALVFTILFPGVPSFATPFEAILRVLTFSVGELEFQSSFYGDERTAPASFITAGIFYGAAVLILHIALLNFLITLTINNVKKISKYSEDWKMYTYIWQMYLMESWMVNLPFQLGKKYLKWCKVVEEQRNGKNIELYISIKLTSLPKYLRKEIRKMNLPIKQKTKMARESAQSPVNIPLPDL